MASTSRDASPLPRGACAIWPLLALAPAAWSFAAWSPSTSRVTSGDAWGFPITTCSLAAVAVNKSTLGDPQASSFRLCAVALGLFVAQSARRFSSLSLQHAESRPRRDSMRAPIRHSAITAQVSQDSKLSCAEWGCRCGDFGQDYPYTSSRDFHRMHPAVSAIATWRREKGLPPPHVFSAPSPRGYRTRKTLGVGEAGSDSGAAVMGMFRKGTWEVAPSHACAVNHPAVESAIVHIQSVLDGLQDHVPIFDHGSRTPWQITSGALRHVEVIVERSTRLVQVVLVWNGERGNDAPALDELIERLWPAQSENEDAQQWHSIWVHWREPDMHLARAIHSKRVDAWQQVRPLLTKEESSDATVVEHLDGLEFSFHPACFQQANLDVFERILHDMKVALRHLSPAGRPLRLLELAGGVGVIGLSLAHAAATWQNSQGVSLLSTDINPHNAVPFIANAKRLFPGASVKGDDQCEVQGASLRFRALSLQQALRHLVQRGDEDLGNFDVVVLDPPRRGLAKDRYHQGFVGNKSGEEEARAFRLCKSLKGIIYMSCGSDSFMVDADRLTKEVPADATDRWGRPFKLMALACYDMFPYTSHAETLGIFVRS